MTTERQVSSTPSDGSSDKFAAPNIEFQAVNKLVYVYHPPPTKKGQKAVDSKELLRPINTHSGRQPSSVLILGWMGAPLRIITKYAIPYTKLFPHATIIIQLSTGSAFISKKEERQEVSSKVVRILEDVEMRMKGKNRLRDEEKSLQESGRQAGLRLDVDTQGQLLKESEEGKGQERAEKLDVQETPRGVFVHTFSDGGSRNLTELLPLLVQSSKAPSILANISDCSPNHSSPRSAAAAFTMPLLKRHWLIYYTARAAIYLYLRIFLTLKMILGRKSWSQVMRAYLNDPTAWKKSWEQNKERKKGEEVGNLPPRCYLYSKADELVDYKAVEEHARDAARVQGLMGGPRKVEELRKGEDLSNIVAVRRWESAPHCDILRADEEGYWKAIRQFIECVV